MNASPSVSPHEIPPLLRDVLRDDPESMDVSPMFTAALAYARSGFSIVPCKENAKAPHSTESFRSGAKSATSDFERVRDHWYQFPDDNIGVASTGELVLADIDPRNGGSLEAAERTGLPVDGYREQTVSGGWRIPLLMPPGVVARRSAQPVPGVEIKAGGSYAVAPHSRIGGRWYRPEPGRDIWRFGAIPRHWEFLDLLIARTPKTYALVVTEVDEEDAYVLEQEMRMSSDYHDGIAALLNGDPDWPRYFPTAEDVTESGRDFQLARAATHFLRDHGRRDHVLAALISRHSAKVCRHENPGSYVAHVVAGAATSRDTLDLDLRLSFAARFVWPTLQPHAAQPNTVLDGTFRMDGLRKGEHVAVLEQSILAFASSGKADEFSYASGWRRLPVQMIADICGVDRKTVTRRLQALETRGEIEWEHPTKKHDGRPRRDSLIRSLRNT